MNIREFAEKYRLKAKTESACNETIIAGKFGHIYQHGADLYGVMFVPRARQPRKWTYGKQQAIAAGLVLYQDGDCEGTLLFDPGNKAQVRAAMKLTGIKKRRKATEDQIAHLARIRPASINSSVLTGEAV